MGRKDAAVTRLRTVFRGSNKKAIITSCILLHEEGQVQIKGTEMQINVTFTLHALYRETMNLSHGATTKCMEHPGTSIIC